MSSLCPKPDLGQKEDTTNDDNPGFTGFFSYLFTGDVSTLKHPLLPPSTLHMHLGEIPIKSRVSASNEQHLLCFPLALAGHSRPRLASARYCFIGQSFLLKDCGPRLASTRCSCILRAPPPRMGAVISCCNCSSGLYKVPKLHIVLFTQRILPFPVHLHFVISNGAVLVMATSYRYFGEIVESAAPPQ